MRATPQTFLRFIAGAAVAAAVLFLVWYFRSIVVYVLISAVLAVMGNPLVKRLAALHIKGWKVPRWLAALATLIVIWVVLATLCSLFVPLVFNKIYQLSNGRFRHRRGEHRRTDSPRPKLPARILRHARKHLLALGGPRVGAQAGDRHRVAQHGLCVDRQCRALLRDRYFLHHLHHLLLPAGRGAFLCYDYGDVPRTLSREHHPCARLRNPLAGALFYGNPLRKPAVDGRRVADDDGLRG